MPTYQTLASQRHTPPPAVQGIGQRSSCWTPGCKKQDYRSENTRATLKHTRANVYKRKGKKVPSGRMYNKLALLSFLSECDDACANGSRVQTAGGATGGGSRLTHTQKQQRETTVYYITPSIGFDPRVFVCIYTLLAVTVWSSLAVRDSMQSE